MRWLVIVLVVGCVSADAVPCGDGRTCPANTTCDAVRALCVTEAQGSACNGIDDGKPCDAAGTPGICDRGLCLPGCGDSVTDPNEQCDDGNFASHDGCSSRCLVEVPTWLPIEPRWSGVTSHAAAYHAALDRVVVVGGVGTEGSRDEVWQLGGVTTAVDNGWREVSSAIGAARPGLRSAAAYAYDPVREVLVVFGGSSSPTDYFGDTWEYSVSGTSFNGEPIGTWTQITTPTAPSPRVRAAFAFDENLGKLVLFGGLTTSGTLLSSETWTYDGVWTQLSPTTTPPERYAPAMAFSPQRDRLVLYGGVGGGTETWEFDGVDWTATLLTPNPGGRRSAPMVYDPVRSALVLFGGQVSFGNVASDTWTYDGAWVRLSAAVNPPARRDAALVADPRRNSVLLIGGGVSDEGALADVWELASSGWSNKTPRFGPPGALSAAAAFSPADGTLLAVSGLTSTPAGGYETWAFDGLRWSQEENAPVDRYGHALVFDGANDRYLLISGSCNIEQADCDGYLSSSVYARPRVGGAWTTVAPLPAGGMRMNHAALYDDVRRRVVVVGGTDDFLVPRPGTFVFDGTSWTRLPDGPGPAPGAAPATWDPVHESVIVFDVNGATWALRGDQWEEILPTGSGPAARIYCAMTYDSTRKRHLLVGGRDSAGASLTDVWELDTSVPAWTPVFVAGQTPLPRTEHVLVMHPNARGAVLLSGASGARLARSDSWMLRYLSSTVDEDCGDNQDTDMDGQQDFEDPDCAPPPP